MVLRHARKMSEQWLLLRPSPASLLRMCSLFGVSAAIPFSCRLIVLVRNVLVNTTIPCLRSNSFSPRSAWQNRGECCKIVSFLVPSATMLLPPVSFVNRAGQVHVRPVLWPGAAVLDGRSRPLPSQGKHHHGQENASSIATGRSRCRLLRTPCPLQRMVISKADFRHTKRNYNATRGDGDGFHPLPTTPGLRNC